MKMYVKRFMQRMMKVADENARNMGVNVTKTQNINVPNKETLQQQNTSNDLSMSQALARSIMLGPYANVEYTLGNRLGLPVQYVPAGTAAEMINKLVELGYDLHKDMVRNRLENPNLYKIDPTGLGPNWQNRALYNRELLRLMSEK